MCTKEEVRKVIKETSPAWMRYTLGIMGGGVILILAWLWNTSVQQDETLHEFKTSSNVSLAMLSGKIENLSSGLSNIKELVLIKSSDQYTGSQAKSRNDLVDERCIQFNKRLSELERRSNSYNNYNSENK